MTNKQEQPALVTGKGEAVSPTGIITYVDAPVERSPEQLECDRLIAELLAKPWRF